MGEQEKDNSVRTWLALGVETGRTVGEIASRVVKVGFGEAEYIEPPVRLWYAADNNLKKDLNELGFSDEEVDRHVRFTRQIRPKLSETVRLGD